jgi:hypothetical protein
MVSQPTGDPNSLLVFLGEEVPTTAYELREFMEWGDPFGRGWMCNDVAFQNKKELFEQAIFAFAV